MHLNDPAILRFLRWLAGLLHGDLGTSYANNMPVAELIGGRLVNTLKLAAVTAVVSVPMALLLGITAADVARPALRPGRDHRSSIGVISVPEFMVATLAVLRLRRLAEMAAGALLRERRHRPARRAAHLSPCRSITLAFVISAQMIRMTRAAVIETLNTPYVEMALLKGASRPRIVLRHALPNALGPIVNAVALSLPTWSAASSSSRRSSTIPASPSSWSMRSSTRDLPLIQTCAMIFCLGYLALITAADIVAILSNPRLRK